jgi:hypothetical protein
MSVLYLILDRAKALVLFLLLLVLLPSCGILLECARPSEFVRVRRYPTRSVRREQH